MTNTNFSSVTEYVDFIETWVKSDEVRALVASWGGIVPKDVKPETLLMWLGGFSDEHWDFRRGAERNMFTGPQTTAEQDDAIMAVADQLHIMHPCDPERKHYDHALVLGGLFRSCIHRTQYAAELSKNHTFGTITALGGFRPLLGDEVEQARSVGLTRLNEFDAMRFGMERAFDIQNTPTLSGTIIDTDKNPSKNDWLIATYKDEPLSVMAAPSSQPNIRRANTADTFRWWAERQALNSTSSLLLITSTIYVAYQDALAVRHFTNTYGAQIETVGVPARITESGAFGATSSPQRYLQEIRSAISEYIALSKEISGPQQ